MNIYQEQRRAKEDGFDKAEFVALFPAGLRHCKWVDAYFGLFTIDGLGDGFVTVEQIDDQFPDLLCLPVGKDEAN